MEQRKNSLSALKICRFCLGHNETLSSIYDRNKKPKNEVPLPLKILSCLSVEVFPSDKLPVYICQRCRFFMEMFHEYKEFCRNADERILQYVHDGTSLETMTWPHSLSKIYQTQLKSKPNVMKTESGATVQVTSQDVTDDSEEEDNVFNIKIGDGSEEGPKCIKVVTSKSEDSENTKTPKEVLNYEADLDEEERPFGNIRMRRTTGAKERCYPCDLCNCTYPLKQLLQLHKRQKHRARNVPCNQCNAKFYTKFDLMVHQVRHSDEMPFQCVACDRKFKRHVLLKRHEKMVHADIPQLACSNCPATFLSLEELEAHQIRHIHRGGGERKHECLMCKKRFLHKATLRRHMEVIHPKKPEFTCEYCPAQFSSISRLRRHLRSHAGERLFPCKFCDKSFIRSHHHTRHLRLMHRDELRNSVAGPADQYRCEQCDECFESQDELIYHSAIHATQNLTCPLCQEKFDDVDAVTAHIKSHVNGIEFMCDLCELVFTSREKLDNHLITTHAEELDQEESMEDMDAEEDEDDNGINVKEEEDHMVVEIKKPDGFMLPAAALQEIQSNLEEKQENTNSEESEAEPTFTELSTVDTLAIVRKEAQAKTEEKAEPPVFLANTATTITKLVKAPSPKLEPIPSMDNVRDSQTASILRKAEEVKRKAQQITSAEPSERKEKVAKVEITNLGASDKSLRLLEKELQDLKRTNTRSEPPKTPVRTMETLRNRRPQLHTSTPKTRAESEKKSLASAKSPAVEKKLPERKIVTKENKEPKEAKETKTNSTPARDEREKREEKETPKSIVKNGTSEKNTPEETVRRSTRPSKIKDYAKMIRDKSQDSENDDSDDADDGEYKEVEKSEPKAKPRRASTKTAAKPAAATPSPATPAPAVRKRGRPRKDQSLNKDVPNKIKKEEQEKEQDEEKESEVEKAPEPEVKPVEPPVVQEKQPEKVESAPAGNDANKSPSSEKPPSGGGVLMSPTGQTLKKVPIRALPPGIKPLPLPVNARPMGAGELCEMQIGKKVVKVQKIVMTKAEVEAMAKKGLVEMKDGTMVLKQGIKIPTTDALSLKSLVAEKEAAKESPSKTDKPSLAQSNTRE